jgi:hypothetical protein
MHMAFKIPHFQIMQSNKPNSFKIMENFIFEILHISKPKTQNTEA